jgi:preprotein translocase subunit YajC
VGSLPGFKRLAYTAWLDSSLKLTPFSVAAACALSAHDLRRQAGSSRYEGWAPVGNNPLGTFLPLILLVVVFYFLLIRPQRRRQQEQLQMQNSLTPGARVMTTTGLFGTVIDLDNDDVVLEVAPGVQTRWIKASIGRVVTPVDDAPYVEKDDESPSDSSDTGDGTDSSTKQS